MPRPLRARDLLPGLLLAVGVALGARLAHRALPAAAAGMIGEVLVAVVFGLALGNLWRLPGALAPGIRFAFQTVLRGAIVLLGAGFSFRQLAALGGKALLMIVALMTLALAVAHGLGRLARVPPRLTTLLAVGTAVCGNSAIGAVAPVIRARDKDVSFAVATNTLLGTLAVFVYPLLAPVLGFSGASFGTWAGTAVNDTSQVVATGFAVSEEAGRVATAVKLTRNALMAPVIVLMGLLYSRTRDGARRPFLDKRARHRALPLFVGGFVAMALLNTLGAIDAASSVLARDVGGILREASRLLVLVALAGVGLGTRASAMRRAGPRPLLVGTATAVAVSLASYASIRLFGPAGGP